MLFTQVQQYVKKHSLYPFIWQVASYLSGLALTTCTYTILAHKLQPQTFGLYAFLQWLLCLTTPFLGLGTTSISRKKLIHLQSKETLPGITGIFYFLWHQQCRSILIYTLLAWLLILPFSWLVLSYDPLLLLLSFLASLPFLLSCVIGITLSSVGCWGLLLALQVFQGLITLLLCLIASQTQNNNLPILLLAIALANTITLILAVLCLAYILPLRDALLPGRSLREQLIKAGRPAFLLFCTDMVIWQGSELVLLALFEDPAITSFYFLGILLSTTIVQTIPLFFLPLVRHFMIAPQLSFRERWLWETVWSTVVAFLLCSILLLFCPWFVNTFLGVAYAPLSQLLRILLPGAIFGGMAIPSLTYLHKYNSHSLHRWLQIGLMLLNLGLAFPAIWYWGLDGAALLCSGTQMLSALSSLCCCHYLYKTRPFLV